MSLAPLGVQETGRDSPSKVVLTRGQPHVKHIQAFVNLHVLLVGAKAPERTSFKVAPEGQGGLEGRETGGAGKSVREGRENDKA